MKTKICSKKDSCVHSEGPELNVSDFCKDTSKKDDLRPSCKACAKEVKREYYKNNKDKIKADVKAYSDANPEKLKETQKISNKKYRQSNPDIVNAKTAKRRSAKLNRTPAWADSELIKEFYTEAQRLTKETGIQYHVDHIIPLQNKDISGLHVENNLQVITATENLNKHNKFTPGKY